jgi:hypothetical protein
LIPRSNPKFVRYVLNVKENEFLLSSENSGLNIVYIDINFNDMTIRNENLIQLFSENFDIKYGLSIY